MAAQVMNIGMGTSNPLALGEDVTGPSLLVQLFTNNLTLTADNVLTDFDLALDTGAPWVGLTGSYEVQTEIDGLVTGDYPQIVWLFEGTPSETYYGYVVWDRLTNIVWWAELISPPVPNTGGPGGLVLQINVEFGAVP